ncbi:MAG: hypothetical protein ACFE8N_13045 [Promethearchaeota archaeon]
MIDEKIKRYKQELTIAKKLSKSKYADRSYYDDLINRFEKILRFYEDLKVWRKLSES